MVHCYRGGMASGVGTSKSFILYCTWKIMTLIDLAMTDIQFYRRNLIKWSG
jgi:hypothetical protein